MSKQWFLNLLLLTSNPSRLTTKFYFKLIAPKQGAKNVK